MALIETICPHCQRAATLRLREVLALGFGPDRTIQRTGWTRRFVANEPEQPDASVITAFPAQCTFLDCGGPSILTARVANDLLDRLSPEHPNWNDVHVPADSVEFELLETSPPVDVLAIHPSWPAVARDQLPELVQDLRDGRNSARILAGARTVLDTVLRDLLGDEMNNGRPAAIRSLAEQGVLTESIAAWAQRLWREGSDAAHEGRGSRGQAIDHIEFLKMLLQVAYSLPSQIAALEALDAVVPEMNPNPEPHQPEA